MKKHSKAKVVERHRAEKIGKIFETTNFGPLKIVGYEGAYNVTVEFINTGTLVSDVQMAHINRGLVRDENLPILYGKCFLGTGKYKSKRNGKDAIEYSVWKQVLERCFNEVYKNKHPTYKECVLNEKWVSFQNFAEWYWTQKGAGIKGWHLDKDLLRKGNKEYGPDTCCLMPSDINKALKLSKASNKSTPVGTYQRPNGVFVVGVVGQSPKYVGSFNSASDAFNAYKLAKENHLKSLAEKYKEDIEVKVYEGLYNFKIEITD